MKFADTLNYSPEIEFDMYGPIKFSLFQNYSNPFNPGTTIKFSLPKQDNVNIFAYDVVGQIVVELINKTMEEEYHEVQFTTNDNASGIYYYRLKFFEFTSINKCHY